MASEPEQRIATSAMSGRLLVLIVTGFLALTMIWPLAGSEAVWHWNTDAALFISVLLALTSGCLLLFRCASAPTLPRFYVALAFFVYTGISILLWISGVFLEGIAQTTPAILQSWSTFLARTLLAGIFLIAALGELRKDERDTDDNHVGMTVGVGVLLMVALVALAVFVPLPETIAYGVLGRAQEVLPLVLFLIAAAVFLREGSWIHDRFTYGMVWMVFLQVIAETYLLFSAAPGSSFDVASFLVHSIGLCIPVLTMQSEMFRLFRAAERYRFEQTRLTRRLGGGRTVRKELVAEVFQKAVEQSQDPLYITDSTGRIVFVNDGFTVLSGYPASEVLGETPDFWTAPAAGPGAYAQVFAQVRLRKEPWSCALKNRRKDGNLFEASISISPILNELGEVAWFIVREQDLSETKNKSLILQQILDNMPLGICLMEVPSTRVVLTNNYASLLFRRTGQEQLQQFRDISSLFRLANGLPYPEDRLPFIEVMRTRGATQRDDVAVWKRGGKQREMVWRMHATPIFNAKGELTQVLLAFDDITRQKDLEHKMTDAVSVTAHQLRTPLTGIKWAIDEYRKSEEHGTSPEDRKILFDTLYQATVRMFNVIQGLLDASKLEQGGIEMKPEAIQFDAFVQKVFEEFAHPIGEKKIILKQSVLHTIPELQLDLILLRQVVQNLIDNAVKYTQVGGEIDSILTLEQDRVHWALHDTGIGIPKEDFERLFEKFHRGDNAQRLDAYGMGLGLYTVKSILELLGGEVRCESEEGHGTTFHVLFPVKRA